MLRGSFSAYQVLEKVLRKSLQHKLLNAGLFKGGKLRKIGIGNQNKDCLSNQIQYI